LTLVAAVAIVSFSGLPASTVQSSNVSALGCLTTFASFPMTTPLNAGRRICSSTGKPSAARRATISSLVSFTSR